MRTTISKKENTFNLVMEYQYTYACQVKVEVEHYRHDKQEYFELSYSYSYPWGQPSSIENPAHPFYRKPNVEDPEGVIVAHNEVTSSMVKYLLLDDSSLSKFTGTSTPMRYRRMMMNSLDSLWD